MLKIHGWKLSVWLRIIEVNSNSGHHPTDTGSDKYGVVVWCLLFSPYSSLICTNCHNNEILDK